MAKARLADGGVLSCPQGLSGVTTSGGAVVLGDGTNLVGGAMLQAGIISGLRGIVTTGCSPSSADGMTDVPAPGNMVATSNSLLYVDSNGELRALTHNSAASIATTSLRQPVGATVGINNGLAMLSGTRVAGGGGGGPGIGRLFVYDVNTAAPDAGLVFGVLSNPTSGPVVGRLGTALYVQHRLPSTLSSAVVRVSSTGAIEAQSATLGLFNSTSAPSPVLGEGGLLYNVDGRGKLSVLRQTFAPDAGALWEVPMPGLVGSNTTSAGATLDCNRTRPGTQTGILYITTESGWVVSYIVDSKGLDPTAPWPKYARDSRNTGNVSASPDPPCP
jgi:hypothetical protein